MIQTVEKIRVHIRWQIRRDLPETLAIENQSSPYPWDEDDILRFLRNNAHIGMVSEHGERVVSYMLYELRKKEFRIHKLAVDPLYRCLSIGTQMILKLKGKLNPDRRTRIIHDIRETNLDGQLFLKSQGFNAIKVLPEWFPDSGEDGYLMQYKLASH